MGFQEAVKTALIEKFAVFSGRAGRAEFWWFWVFLWLASIALIILLTIVSVPANSSVIDTVVLIVAWAVSLALFVPGLAVSVRRLHDTDRSGWWLLLSFIPFGGLVLLIFWLQPTGPDNRYGPGAAPATRPAVGQPPAGWYPDPADPSVRRYWDGSQWQTAGPGE